MRFWTEFANFIRDQGIWETYREFPKFNHPPLMGLFAAGLSTLADWTSVPFRILFKLPPLAADLLAVRLLWICWRPHGLLAAAAAVALFSCNPISILVTGFHGNTDSLCAVLILLAAVFHSKAKWLLAGLAIGASINVKIVGVLLLPGLLLLCPKPRDAVRFAFGCGIAFLPFLVVLLVGPGEFYGNVFAYNPVLERWGIAALFLFAVPADSELVDYFIEIYRRIGRFVVIGLTGLCAILGYRRSWDAYRSVAVSISTLLLFAPGFGVQYLVWVVPLFAASSTKYSLRWAASAGLFATLIYSGFLVDEWPLRSAHTEMVPFFTGLFGIYAWAVLALYLVNVLRDFSDLPDHSYCK